MKRQWGWGVLGALGLGFVAVRVNGKLRPKPMPVQIEQFFLTNPLRVSYFGYRDALRLAGDLKGLRVLEVGVGVGVILEEIAKRVGEGGQAFGVDVQSDAVAKAEQRLSQGGLMSRTGLATANALDMPWTDGSMDRVITVAMLGEIPASHRVDALKEARRVLNDEGKLVVTEFWPDPHFIPLSRMVKLLRQAGFGIVDIHQKPFLYSISAKKEG
ncbi:MAG: class I SAM-dependent methyltransferase [Firmicutes bacterium]|nr:class I SAM-dependent methyltransferase [Bacillota bacterium]MCL5014891.1 class I SAM-dependent methyltransferase [Bacillota bacterium]